MGQEYVVRSSITMKLISLETKLKQEMKLPGQFGLWTVWPQAGLAPAQFGPRTV